MEQNCSALAVRIRSVPRIKSRYQLDQNYCRLVLCSLRQYHTSKRKTMQSQFSPKTAVNLPKPVQKRMKRRIPLQEGPAPERKIKTVHQNFQLNAPNSRQNLGGGDEIKSKASGQDNISFNWKLDSIKRANLLSTLRQALMNPNIHTSIAKAKVTALK